MRPLHPLHIEKQYALVVNASESTGRHTRVRLAPDRHMRIA
jgi:hypothetical protein